MSGHDIRMIVLSTDDLDESIKFYSETLGMPLKFRDGAHFAALDGGSVTLALATAVDVGTVSLEPGGDVGEPRTEAPDHLEPRQPAGIRRHAAVVPAQEAINAPPDEFRHR